MLSEHKPALVAPGKAVTQHDIARVCGLHQSAVSFALRGDTTHVTPETMARVQAVAAELGYAPHQAARKMVAVRFGKTIINHLIALCFPRDFHRNPYFLEPYLGVMDALADAGFDLLTLAVTGELSADFLAKSPAVARGDVDAIIAFSIPAMIHSLHEQARALPAFGARPFIALIQPMTDCSTVLYDDEQAAYEIGCHLLALGHRHLLALMVPCLRHLAATTGWLPARLRHLWTRGKQSFTSALYPHYRLDQSGASQRGASAVIPLD